MIKKLPNILTWFRIISIPFLLWILSLDGMTSNWVCLALYVFASISDALDGYIARKYQAYTRMGAFLDPLADKMLVLATLIVLVDLQRVFTFLVIVSLLRELSITGLRLIALEQKIQIESSSGGKLKTIFQMVAIGFLIAGPSWDQAVPQAYTSFEIGNFLLGLSLLFSLKSAFDYILKYNQKGKWA